MADPVRWVRFVLDGRERFGALHGEHIQPHAGDLFGAATPDGETIATSAVALLPPVRPRLFIGLWNNFRALAEKQGNATPDHPLWFAKSPGSVVGPDAPIPMPAGYNGRVLYEGELGLVIGRRVSRADEAEAAAAIFGLTIVNDVTALDWLTADPAFPQWARAKGCDGFGPVGPCIATGLDWRDLTVRVALNGRVRQNYRADDMILSPQRIVSLLSHDLTLEPGDLVACGTSLGALPMQPGMVVEVTIDGIGTLRNVFAG